MNEIVIDKKEELVMKLLHYFITERGYNPVIIRGVKDEIWLENLEDDYKIIMVGVTKEMRDILPKRLVTYEKTDSLTYGSHRFDNCVSADYIR